MKTGLNLRQTGVQTLTMTPQLQQAIRLLQLSAAELRQEIQNNLDKNPFLEADESDGDAGITTSLEAISESEYSREVSPEDISPFNDDTTLSLDNAPYAGGDSDGGYAALGGENSRDGSISHESANIQNDEVEYWQDNGGTGRTPRGNGVRGEDIGDFQGAAPRGLADYLKWQLNLTPMPDADRLIAEAVIDGVNESGYLTETTGDILLAVRGDLPSASEADVERVLKTVQRFDPPGIASRSVRESLLLQLEQFDAADPAVVLARKIIADHLELLGKKDFRALARHLELKDRDAGLLREAVKVITGLEPRPGNCIPQEKSEYIIPDVAARKRGGRWIAELNPSAVPKIRLNEKYCELCSSVRTPRESNYIKTHIQEASSFLQSVRKRNETLFKVASCIVEHQQDFFERGAQFMRPLILNDIAAETGFHESTISRVTTEKYILTPRGTFELKYFFSSHVSSDSGDELSSTAIRAKIKELIGAENAQKPLSDSRLSRILAESGIVVARRTIAKYREALNIPPSNLRKSI